MPGSWINANFNVWIGAPEDNRSWDYLYHARNFYEEASSKASETQRKLAFEELLIAEGSDWNWWYGPEHHSANDREFDELYRKHLSNVYQALGGSPPDYLAQPITGGMARPSFVPQTAYIRPHITGERCATLSGWARRSTPPTSVPAPCTARSLSWTPYMPALTSSNVYGRLDFADQIPQEDFELVVNLESRTDDGQRPRRVLRLDASARARKLDSWKITAADEEQALGGSGAPQGAALVLNRNFEFKIPLAWLLAAPVSSARRASEPVATRVRLRFSLWQNRLPVDALPLEGWIELQLVGETELMSA